MNLTHSIRFGLFQPGLTGNIVCLYHRHSCAVEIESSSACRCRLFQGQGEKFENARARSHALLRDLQNLPKKLTGACHAGGKDWVTVADNFCSRIRTVSQLSIVGTSEKKVTSARRVTLIQFTLFRW